jgi:hypothetical protein
LTPDKIVAFRAEMNGTANRIKRIAIVDYSPEKAGVGGSIPSLATTF